MASRSQQRTLPGLDRVSTSIDVDEPDAASQKMVSASRDTDQPAISDSDADGEACDREPLPVDIKGWNVYVVDAHSLIFQVFHALPEMSSPRGEQVGAVY